MATAFVTGASGFVGRHLVRHLRALKWHVVCLVRPTADITDLQASGAIVITGDAASRDCLLRVMPLNTDVVFQLAGIQNMPSYMPVNLMQFNETALRASIFAAVEKRAKSFVFLSDALVYGFPGIVFDETLAMPDPDPARIPCAYVRSKRDCESIMKRAVLRGLDAMVVNPGPIVGPNMSAAASISRPQFLTNHKHTHIPAGSRCFVDVETVIKTLLAAAERGVAGENYLIGGPLLSWHEAFAAIRHDDTAQMPPARGAKATFNAVKKRIPHKLSQKLGFIDKELIWLGNGVQDFVNHRVQQTLGIFPPDMSNIKCALNSINVNNTMTFTQN